MAQFKSFVITELGQALMAKLLAGTATGEFTKIKVSDTIFTDDQLIGLLDIGTVRQECLVSLVTRLNETTVNIKGAMNNTELTTGYYVNTIGLFAQDPDVGEILYAVSIAEVNGYMPPFSGLTSSGLTFDFVVTVGNASQVSVTINPAALATSEQVEAVAIQARAAVETVNEHVTDTVSTEDGVHGIRVHEGKIQTYDAINNTWVDVESGGGGMAPNNVSGLKLKVMNRALQLRWEDPEDTYVEGQLLVTWKGTKLLMKQGAFPENVHDGTQLVDNQVRNAYQTTGFVVENLQNEVEYFFQLFPYSDSGATNQNELNRISGTPMPYKTMTVAVDLSNSNPATSCTYEDDAADMTPGSDAWDTFFGYYPCLFKDGAEVGELNPNNFAQFKDGSAADITSGSAGDVMIAFIERGVRITTTGNILRVSMTDDPGKEGFQYYAHRRGNEHREKFYLGAYKGYVASGKLRSLSGKAPTATQTIGTFRSQAHALGAGYENSGFYQLIFRQVMYLLKYRTLDSQSAVGRGYVDGNTAAVATGGTNAKGMTFGETTGKQQMKLFGLEDFWGNIWEWIDGIVTDGSHNMLTATDNFNDAGTGYTNQGKGASANIGNYMSKPQGTTETGFLAKEVNGSETTYFCDGANLRSGCVGLFGGHWNPASNAGAFRLNVDNAASYSSASISARLMYL